MQVILKQDVKSLGKKDSLVNVSDGYAKNFLFPRGLAVEATTGNVNDMKEKNKSVAQKKERDLEQAKELAKRLSDIELDFKIKAGDNGKLFGSITGKDISEKLLAKHKIDIDKKKVVLQDALKTLGTKEVEIKVHPGVTATIKVRIEQE